MNKKALFSGLTTIVWSVLLIIILTIFGFLFIQQQNHLEAETIKTDNTVFWEPNYLAAHVAKRNINNERIIDYVSRKESFTEDEEEELGEVLKKILEEIKLPERDNKEALYIAFVVKGDTYLCVKVPSVNRDTLCNPNSRRGIPNQLAARMVDGMSPGIVAIKRSYEENGGVGIVPVPGETPGIIGVVVYR